jgi:hypothetical protein
MGDDPNWDPNYRNPGLAKVRLTLFWASNYKIDTASALTQSGDSQHALGVRVCAHGTDGMRDSGLFGQEAA